VIREQRSLLRSWYAQYIRDGGVLSLEAYLRPGQPELWRVPQHRFEFYEFDRLIGRYCGLFGADRVLALPFEMLTRSPEAFVERIVRFSGSNCVATLPREPRNVGMAPIEVSFQRIGNRLFNSNQLGPGPLLDAPRAHRLYAAASRRVSRLVPAFIGRRIDNRLRQVIAHAVARRYSESNDRTCRMIGVPLWTMGYDCSGRVEKSDASECAADANT
jgi:hypothetical protein